MSPTDSNPRADGASPQPHRIEKVVLSGVGVRYRRVSDEHRSIKGQVLSRRKDQDHDFWALRDISATFSQGDVIGLLGQNGSGKSTLLRVLARVIEPARGTVKVNGEVHPILELGGAFNAELSGRENAYLYGSIFRIGRKRMEEEIVPQVVEFSGLGEFFDAPIKSYSSGMIARLAFSLATQIEPDILLLDEVLSVGDESFQHKSLDRMKRLIDGGKLVVMVSHSAELLAQVCNRILCLQHGRLVADGDPETSIRTYRSLLEG